MKKNPDPTPGPIRHSPDPRYAKGSLVRDQNGTGFVIAACDYVPNSEAGRINDSLEANAKRIAATWNACIGLEIPEGIEPGAVDNLVDAVHTLLHAYRKKGYGVGEEVEEVKSILKKFEKPAAAPKKDGF